MPTKTKKKTVAKKATKKVSKPKIVNKPKVVKKPTVAKTPAKVAIIPKHMHHVVILDRSGSMESVRAATISGYNENAQKVRELAKTQKKQSHHVTLVTFADEHKNVSWKENISSLVDLTTSEYAPSGGTALCDAMCFTMNKLNEELSKEASEKNPIAVLVTVITDGMENSSRTYSHAGVASMIEKFKGNPYLIWTITYMGANHDVAHAAKSLNIPISNVARYSSSVVGTQEAFSNHSKSRSAYASSLGSQGFSGYNSANFFSSAESVADFTQPTAPATPANPADLKAAVDVSVLSSVQPQKKTIV